MNAAAITRNDLIARVRRLDADLKSVGASTESVGQKVHQAFGMDHFEAQLAHYPQPTLGEMKAAATAEVQTHAADTRHHQVAMAGVAVAVAGLLLLGAGPVAAGIAAAAGGVEAVQWIRADTALSEARDVQGSLADWQKAYDGAAAQGNLARV